MLTHTSGYAIQVRYCASQRPTELHDHAPRSTAATAWPTIYPPCRVPLSNSPGDFHLCSVCFCPLLIVPRPNHSILPPDLHTALIRQAPPALGTSRYVIFSTSAHVQNIYPHERIRDREAIQPTSQSHARHHRGTQHRVPASRDVRILRIRDADNLRIQWGMQPMGDIRHLSILEYGGQQVNYTQTHVPRKGRIGCRLLWYRCRVVSANVNLPMSSYR